MLTCLVLMLLIPVVLVLVAAILIGFGALFFTLLRFVLPIVVVGVIIWLVVNHLNQRNYRNTYRTQYRHPDQQVRRKRVRKDITDHTTHKDDDNWNDF